ncbi:MAG: winged helix-turn-helix transcriptional regulator [Chloroflexi bacterium]|nr:winged helix-turn-helix transcriptional regulator [Chloroflexota bacterium]
MELIITPPKIAVRFRASLIHSLLTTAGLLYFIEQLEAVSDWLRQVGSSLRSDIAERLYPLNAVILFATGTQGYLIDSLSGDADTTYDALRDGLLDLQPALLQGAALQAFQEYLTRIEVVGKNMSLPDDPGLLAQLVKAAHAHQEARWESRLSLPLPPEDLAHLLLDADALHAAITDGIDVLWHEIYAPQAAIDIAQHQAAVRYHAERDYSGDFPAIFRAVTGRTLPERLQQLVSSTRHVDMVPASHIGAHITVAILGDRWWVGFNANLVPAQRGSGAFAPELYPGLKALADETRLKIMTLLAEGELNVGEIADALELTQSTTSRHLSLLAKTNILTTRRDGTMRYYSLNQSALDELATHLKNFTRVNR